MAEISPETRELTPEETDRIQRETERRAVAQEFLAEQEQAGKQGAPVVPAAEPPGFDNVETRLQQPLPPEVDLAERILAGLRGKTPQEKITELLNGNYSAAAKSEAMARLIEEQDLDKAA